MAEKEKRYKNIEPGKIHITDVGLAKLRARLAEKEHSLIQKKKDGAIESDDEWVHHNEAARDARFDLYRAEDEVGVIQKILAGIISIIHPNSDTEIVDIGNKVTVEFLDDNAVDNIVIVGKHDADANDMFVSYESPMAKALFGKKKGDTVSFEGGGGHKIVVKIKGITPGEF